MQSLVTPAGKHISLVYNTCVEAKNSDSKTKANKSLRFTVPVLWDKKTNSIVNNESSEIIRIFNTAFNHLLPHDEAALDLYPEALRPQIDEINAWIYPNINSTNLSCMKYVGNYG